MGEQMAIDLLTPFTKVELKAKKTRNDGQSDFFGVILILFMLAI